MREMLPSLTLLLAIAVCLPACTPGSPGNATAAATPTPSPAPSAEPTSVGLSAGPSVDPTWLVGRLTVLASGATQVVWEPWNPNEDVPTEIEVWYSVDDQRDRAQKLCRKVGEKHKGSVIRKINGLLPSGISVHLPDKAPGPQPTGITNCRDGAYVTPKPSPTPTP